MSARGGARSASGLGLALLLAVVGAGVTGGVRGLPQASAFFGDVAEFTPPGDPGRPGKSLPVDITKGPDGNLWFTERNGARIGKITPGGAITEYPLPVATSIADGITLGPDGNLWFTESQGGLSPATGSAIGRISISGVVTRFPLPDNPADPGRYNRGPTFITAGPDGNLWFTERRSHQIARMDINGNLTGQWRVPGTNPRLIHIIAGPDGNLWFTEQFGNNIGRITPTGAISEFAVPTALAGPTYLAAGPDGNIWFTEYGCVSSDAGSSRRSCNASSPPEPGNRIARINPATGVITEFSTLPTNNSKPAGLVFDAGGTLWFTEQAGNKLASMDSSGGVTEHAATLSPQSLPTAITVGPDQNIWFTEFYGEDSAGTGLGGKIGRFQTAVARFEEAAGRYTPLPPARILDTRGGTTLGANQAIEVQVADRGGVPATGVGAVAINVTATNSTRASYLTLYPSGAARPLASNLNFPAGRQIANLAVVRVGRGGTVMLYNSEGSVDVIFDVQGWFSKTPGTGNRGLFNPVAPVRVLDTRTDLGGHPGRLGPDRSLTLKVAGSPQLPEARVGAVVLNVTTVDGSQDSYVTVYPPQSGRPLASNVNFPAHKIVPNRVMVQVSSQGEVSIYNLAGEVDIVVDLGGWFGTDSAPGGSLYHPAVPARIFDSRAGARLAAGEARPVPVFGRGEVPRTARAVLANVTVTEPTEGSFLTVHPSDVATPLASDLNYPPGDTVPNLVVVKLGADGGIRAYNNLGSTHIVVDVGGWFE